jgi:hypothetical protein
MPHKLMGLVIGGLFCHKPNRCAILMRRKVSRWAVSAGRAKSSGRIASYQFISGKNAPLFPPSGGGRAASIRGEVLGAFGNLVDCFFVNTPDMTYTHNTGKSSMTLGNGRFTAYFTRLMGVPLTLLSRVRHAAWMWAIIWLGARLTAQNAYVQLIHTVADVVGVNSPVILDSIDVYISTNGGSTWTLAVPDFKFRQATSFIALPANNNQLRAGIAPGNSTGPGDILPVQYSIPPLTSNTYYVAAIAGTVSTSQVDVNIYYFSPARNATTGSGANDVDLLLFHGSPDAGPVSYYWAFDRTQHAYVRDGYLSYRGYSTGYRTLPFENVLVLGDSADVNVIRGIGYYYPARSNNAFWGGQSAGVVFISGYASTSDPAKRLGVHMALPDGTVRPLSPREVRRLQVIHNAADPALAQVDIHGGSFPDPNRLQINFRQATPAIFLDGPSGVSLPVYVSARGNTTSYLVQSTFTLPAAGQNTAVFAQGVLNPSQFAANPDGRGIGFEFVTLTNLVGTAPTGSMKIFPFHGATDAPTVDLEIVGVGTVPGLKYKDAGPAVTLSSNAVATLKIKQGSSVLATYTLSQSQSRDATGAIIFASGFLSPANNQNGPAFGLYIVYPTGEVQPLSLQSSLSRGLVEGVQVATLPAYEGSWTVTVAAAAAGKLPYRLVSITGQILQEGEWNVPSAGTWIYALPAHSYSSGMYLLQIGEASYRLLK